MDYRCVIIIVGNLVRYPELRIVAAPEVGRVELLASTS